MSDLHKLHRCELKMWAKSGYQDSDSIKYVFANLNDAAYKPTYKEKHNVLWKSGLDKEYKIVPELSSRDINVFYDIDCSKYVIVFKGTDYSNKFGRRYNDLYSDFLLGIGKFESTKYYKAADKATKAMIDKYGANNVILSGHSLGGRTAGGLSIKYNVPSIIYNEGSSPLDYKYNRAENKQTTHFTTNSISDIVIDPLSITSIIDSNKKTIKQEVKDAPNKTYLQIHGLDNFLNKKVSRI
jgi:hypothetical protein